jgi:hypothetical protein
MTVGDLRSKFIGVCVSPSVNIVYVAHASRTEARYHQHLSPMGAVDGRVPPQYCCKDTRRALDAPLNHIARAVERWEGLARGGLCCRIWAVTYKGPLIASLNEHSNATIANTLPRAIVFYLLSESVAASLQIKRRIRALNGSILVRST